MMEVRSTKSNGYNRNMRSNSIYVLLEDIRSTYNVGSVFRTCDAAGINSLFLTGITAYPPHPKLNKTALGSLSFVKWQWYEDPVKIITNLKAKGIHLIALESDRNAPSIFAADLSFPCCLVFGNEVTGISKQAQMLCDQTLTIPQVGKKESLNISIAVGIAIYEARRKSLLCPLINKDTKGKRTQIL